MSTITREAVLAQRSRVPQRARCSMTNSSRSRYARVEDVQREQRLAGSIQALLWKTTPPRDRGLALLPPALTHHRPRPQSPSTRKAVAPDVVEGHLQPLLLKHTRDHMGQRRGEVGKVIRTKARQLTSDEQLEAMAQTPEVGRGQH